MAPERLVEDGAVDYRCDLFSLGVILYQMATGTRPFEIEPRSALIAAIREQPHVPVRQLPPAIRPSSSGSSTGCWRSGPTDRYQTATGRARRPRPAEAGRARNAGRRPGASGGRIRRRPAVRDHRRDDEASRERPRRAGRGHQQPSQRLPGLRVAPRTSTRAVVGQSIREIGRRLGVEMVLEGTVQRTDDRVRVIANLVDPADERSVLPAHPDRPPRRRSARRPDRDRAATSVTASRRSLSRSTGRELHAGSRRPPTPSSAPCITGDRASPAAGVRRSNICSTRSSATRTTPRHASRWPTPTTSSASTAC